MGFSLDYYIERLDWPDIVDILLVAALIYGLLLLVRAHAVPLLRGLLVLALFFVVLSLLIDLVASPGWFAISCRRCSSPFGHLPAGGSRRALEQLGRTGRFVRLFRRNRESAAVTAVARACLRLSQRRHGALIVFEQDTGLQEYIDTGILLNAEPSTELLLTIFNKNTELHDGAVIVRGEKLVAAAAVMPLSTSSLSDRQMGLRHRAGLGISEVSDAVAVVVSEETGQIAIAHNGRILRRQDPGRLDAILTAFLQNSSGIAVRQRGV